MSSCRKKKPTQLREVPPLLRVGVGDVLAGLVRNAPGHADGARAVRDEVQRALGDWVAVRLVGSFATGTAVPGISDVDLCVSVKELRRAPGWLGRAVSAVSETLPGASVVPTRASPLVRARVRGVAVDIVLGDADEQGRAVRWVRKVGNQLGCLRAVVRALKTLLWHHGLMARQVRGGVPSFVLLCVVVALMRGRLSDALLCRWPSNDALVVAFVDVVRQLAELELRYVLWPSAGDPALVVQPLPADLASGAPRLAVRHPIYPEKDCAARVTVWPHFAAAMRDLASVLTCG